MYDDVDNLRDSDFTVSKEDLFNIRDVLNCLEETLAINSKYQSIKIYYQMSVEIPELVKGNKYQLQKLLLILLLNGITSSKGGGKLCILSVETTGKISKETIDVNLRFSVRDNGLGFDYESIRKQVKRKYTSIFDDEVANTLRYVKKFTRMLHGHLKYSSSPGKGSNITIELPFKLIGNNRIVSYNSLDSLAYREHTNSYQCFRVLIVDDSIGNRKALSRLLLTKFGFYVDTVNDGLEFISKIENNVTKSRYDLILLDNSMPNMSGAEAISYLRHKGYNGLVFGLTACSFYEDVKSFHNAGCNIVLLKPFSVEIFISTLRQFGIDL